MSRRVCLYPVATHLGGGERSLLDLATGLRDRPELGYEPWVLVPKPEGPLVEQLRARGLPYEALPMPRGFLRLSRGAEGAALALGGARAAPATLAYVARLAALLRRRRVAILHSNGLKCHFLSALTGAVAGSRVLWHLRDILDDGPALWALRGLRELARTSVVANSAATSRAFGGGAGFVVHNGLDPEQFRREPNGELRERLGLAPGTPVVGIVGALARWKGQLEFLRMARILLIERGLDAGFAVIGGEIYDTASPDAGLEGRLREEAERLGIARRVHFTGFVDDAARAINGLDVLVHASVRPEPFGRVIVEAMACGVPVVAADAGGVPELVRDGETGLLAPPGGVAAMADAVARLLTDPGRRTRLADRAREDFLERFTLERHVRGIAAVYDAISR
jgi:glycosyltransferase involved in cell wall biosynthesis